MAAAAVVAGYLATDSDREGMQLEVGHIAGCCHPAWGEGHVQGEEHGWVEGVPAWEGGLTLEEDPARVVA